MATDSEPVQKLCLKLNLNASGVHEIPFSGGGPFRINTLKHPEWFVCVEDTKNVSCKGAPGYQGEFLFEPIGNDRFLISTVRWKNWYISVGNDRFLISTVRWKNWYLYMMKNAEGTVQAWDGKPGQEGHWLLTPRDDGSFLLSNDRWPTWHIYMEEKESGVTCIRGCEGDPGPPGHFVFSSDFQLCKAE